MKNPVIIRNSLFGLSTILILAPIVMGQLGTITPLSDDISMIAFSTRFSWDWFTRGLADYFIAYPEYYVPQSNFIRPVSNFAFWLFSNVFSDATRFQSNAIQLIVLNYGILALIATLLFSQVYTISRSLWLASFSGLFAISIPAFWTTPTPSYTSFVFDELATLFCLLAFISVRRASFGTASLLLVLAIFTKEISLPVFVAFGIWFALHRYNKAALSMIFGFATWVGLRVSAYGFQTDGLYVFAAQDTSLTSWALVKMQNVFTLPIGPVFFNEIGLIGSDEVPLRSTLLLGLNLLIYGLTLWMIAKAFSRFSTIRIATMPLLSNSQFALTALSSLFSFLFVAYVGANYRYAFIFLPFYVLAVSYATQFRKTQICVLIALLIGSLLASFSSVQRYSIGNPFETYRYHIMRDLMSVLRTQDTSRQVVIVNDAVIGYASPEALRMMLNRQGAVVRGTSLYLDNCPVSELQNVATRLDRSDSTLRVNVTLPECARFTFESSPRIGAFVKGKTIQRSSEIHYELEADPRLNDPDLSHYWLGSSMTLVVNTSPQIDVVYFDFQQSKWIYLKP